MKWDFPGDLSDKESAHQCRRFRFDPWVRNIPRKRKWHPTLVFFLGKSHEQRSLVGYSLWAHKRVRHDLMTKQQQQHIVKYFSVQFSRSVVSDSLWPHGLEHTRVPCLSPIRGAYSNSITSVMPSNYLILCHPLLLPSIFPSIRVFSNESVLHIKWWKYWHFSFSISPSNEFSGLISFRIDWFDLLTVEGILKSLLQHHSSKASVLWHSAFFLVQLTFIHDYWKNHSFD